MISQVQAGLAHSVVVRDGGDVYFWGKYNHLNDSGDRVVQVFEEPTRVEKDDQTPSERPVEVFCSATFTLLLNENGSQTVLFAPDSVLNLFLNPGNRTRYLRKHGTRFPLSCFHHNYITATRVAVGTEHALLVDDQGRLYSFGVGASGALGHGDILNKVEPTLVAGLENVHVTSIAAGSKHSMCSTDAGHVYCWGSGEFSRLGTSSHEGKWSPAPLPIKVFAKQVACGESHSGFVSDKGEVYIWGSGAFGRLGIGIECVAISTPTAIESLPEPVAQLSLGMTHSCCVTQSGRLFAWGSGSGGKLGFHLQDGSVLEDNVLLPTEPFPGCQEFTQVSCGTSHTLALLKSKGIVSFGTHGAPCVGIRAKTEAFRDVQDLEIRQFQQHKDQSTSRRVSSFSTSQTVAQQQYEPRFPDDMVPVRLSKAERKNCDNIIEVFKKTGSLPVEYDNESMRPRVMVERLVSLLRAETWSGSGGLSNASLRNEAAAFVSAIDNFRSLWIELNYVQERFDVEETNRARRIECYMVENVFGMKGKMANEARRRRFGDPNGSMVLSLKGLSAEEDVTTQNDVHWNTTGCFSGCFPVKTRKMKRLNLKMEQMNSRQLNVLDALSVVYSTILRQPYLVFLFFKHCKAQTTNDVFNENHSLLDHFLSLVRDLYVPTDKLVERKFRRCISDITVHELEEILAANPNALNSEESVSHNGMFNQILHQVYWKEPLVRGFFLEKLRPLLEKIRALNGDLDLNPKSVSITLDEARKRAQDQKMGNRGTGLVYLKPCHEDDRSGDEVAEDRKKHDLYQNRVEVRRNIEGKITVVGRMLNEFTDLLHALVTNPLPLMIADIFQDYLDNLQWSFNLKETCTTIRLTTVKAFYHFAIEPIFKSPKDYVSSFQDLKENSQPSRLFFFNMSQFQSIVERCFSFGVDEAFDRPWYGALKEYAAKLQATLSTAAIFPGATSQIPQRTSSEEMKLLGEVVAEHTREHRLIIYPSDRVVEFTKFSLVPFLIQQRKVLFGNDTSVPKRFSNTLSILQSLLDLKQDERMATSRRRGRKLSKRSASNVASKPAAEETVVNFSDYSDKDRITMPLDARLDEPLQDIEQFLPTVPEVSPMDFIPGKALELMVASYSEELLRGEQTLYDFVGVNLTAESISKRNKYTAGSGSDAYNFDNSVSEKVLASFVERSRLRNNLQESMSHLVRLNDTLEASVKLHEEKLEYLQTSYEGIMSGAQTETNREQIRKFVEAYGLLTDQPHM